MIGPFFFQQKVYEWPNFSGFLCERPHFSDILVYAHIFRSEIFRGCLSSWYYMNWLWYLCNNQQKWVQKIKGQYMNRSTFWMIKYMNGSVFSKARYMNGVGFEILARTPVPKLPLSYPPHPPSPPPPPEMRTAKARAVWSGALLSALKIILICLFWDISDAQDYLNMNILNMSKITFSLNFRPY